MVQICIYLNWMSVIYGRNFAMLREKFCRKRYGSIKQAAHKIRSVRFSDKMNWMSETNWKTKQKQMKRAVRRGKSGRFQCWLKRANKNKSECFAGSEARTLGEKIVVDATVEKQTTNIQANTWKRFSSRKFLFNRNKTVSKVGIRGSQRFSLFFWIRERRSLTERENVVSTSSCNWWCAAVFCFQFCKVNSVGTFRLPSSLRASSLELGQRIISFEFFCLYFPLSKIVSSCRNVNWIGLIQRKHWFHFDFFYRSSNTSDGQWMLNIYFIFHPRTPHARIGIDTEIFNGFLCFPSGSSKHSTNKSKFAETKKVQNEWLMKRNRDVPESKASIMATARAAERKKVR